MANYLKNLAGFQSGGTFTVSKPTLIAVHPNELIDITPFRKMNEISTRGKAEINLNINSPLIQTTGLSRADLENAGHELYAIIQQQIRRFGRVL